jgi:hypothetical protein
MKNPINKQPLRFGICSRVLTLLPAGGLNSEILCKANIADNFPVMDDLQKMDCDGFSSVRFDYPLVN